MNCRHSSPPAAVGQARQAAVRRIVAVVRVRPVRISDLADLRPSGSEVGVGRHQTRLVRHLRHPAFAVIGVALSVSFPEQADVVKEGRVLLVVVEQGLPIMGDDG